MALQHSLKLKPLSIAIALVFAVAPISLLAAEAVDLRR